MSPSRARSLFRPLLASACYAGYKFCTPFVFHFSWVLQPSKEKLKTILIWPPSTKERTSRAGLIVYAFECTSAIKGFKYRTSCRCLLVRTVSKRRLIKENCSSFSICKSNCENVLGLWRSRRWWKRLVINKNEIGVARGLVISQVDALSSKSGRRLRAVDFVVTLFLEVPKWQTKS